MKKMIILISMLLFTCAAYGQVGWKNTEVDIVFDKWVTLSAQSGTVTYTSCSSTLTSIDTSYSSSFVLECDTLSFYAEIAYSDSAANGHTYTTDSIMIYAKVRPYTTTGQTDSTTWANWKIAVDKSTLGGLVHWGDIVCMAKPGMFWGRLYVHIGNGYATSNKVHVRIFRVRTWRR